RKPRHPAVVLPSNRRRQPAAFSASVSVFGAGGGWSPEWRRGPGGRIRRQRVRGIIGGSDRGGGSSRGPARSAVPAALPPHGLRVPDPFHERVAAERAVDVAGRNRDPTPVGEAVPAVGAVLVEQLDRSGRRGDDGGPRAEEAAGGEEEGEKGEDSRTDPH